MPKRNQTKSVDDDVNCRATTSSEAPATNSDDVTEQWAFQNLTEEKRLKLELEREEQKCVNLKSRIENVNQESSNVDDSNCQLRKILAEKQAEIQEIRQEIKTQTEVIHDVCNRDRLQNFSDVMSAISHVAKEYEDFRDQLGKEIKNCKSHYADIQKMRDEAKDVLDSILAARKEQEGLINQVESNIIKLNSLLDNVPDEKIELLREEIDKCVAVKNNSVALLVKKANMAEELKQSIEEEEKGRAHAKDDVSSQVDKWEGLQQSDLDEINARFALVIAEAERRYALQMETEEYKSIINALKNLETESQNSEEYTETLLKDIETCEKKTLECESDIELKKQEMEMERYMMKKYKTEFAGNEGMVAQRLQEEQDLMDKELVDIGSKIETLRSEMPVLENELINVDQLLIEDMEVLKNSCVSWRKQLDDETVKLISLSSRDDVVEIFETLPMISEGGDGVEGLKVDTVSIEKLESSARQLEDRLKREMDETDRIMKVFHEEIQASALEAEESELFLEMFDKEGRCFEELHTSKQFENWNSKRESTQKVSELEELNKNLIAETALSERTQDLLRDLERNTIRKDELCSHPLFHVYQTKLATLTALEKKREKRVQEMKLLLEKLENYTDDAN